MREWPLVGRICELATLSRLLRDANSNGVIIAGPQGVGKSRLASECQQMADELGFSVCRITATKAARTVPLGAFAALLPSTEVQGNSENRASLLRRCVHDLVDQAGDRRLFLMVDDAHQLDDASATLLHQLVVGRAGFVIATLRPRESLPDALTDLWKDGLLERLDLEALSDSEVRTLLGLVLDGHIDHGAAEEFFARSVGNVLFLRELVAGALASGALQQDGRLWRMAGDSLPSQRLVEIVEARLRGLTDDERAMLELVSLGEPLGSAELAALGDPVVVETLERQGLLSSSVDGLRLEIRLAHPIYGDVIRSATPAVRVRALARRIADVVEATGARRREDLLRIATWRLSCGGGRPELMLAAAETARWRYDYPLAERLARAAVDAGAGFEARLLVAQLASLQGRMSLAEDALLPLVADACTDAQRARVAVARLENFVWSANFVDAQAALEEAELAVTDSAWVDELEAARAWLAVSTQGPRQAAEAAAPLLLRSSGRTLVWACLTEAYSLIRMGQLESGAEALERFRVTSLQDGGSLEWYPWYYAYTRTEAMLQAGQFAEADMFVTEQHRQTLLNQSQEARAFLVAQLARVSLARGMLRTASEQATEGAAALRQQGKSLVLRDCLASLVVAQACQGRSADALRTLDEIEDLSLPPAMYGSCEILRAKAWAAAADDQTAQACLFFEQAAEVGSSVGDLTGAAEALHGIVRLGRSKDAVQRLSELADQIDGDFVQARSRHAHALSTRNAAALEEVVATFEGMGALLLAAEGSAQAAALWAKLGNQRFSTSAERRARDLRGMCEGAATPALRLLAVGPRLTPAEQQAALLASRGLPNKGIADQLGLTVRTVETRLQHVYEKLGVGRRGELAKALEGASEAQ